MTGYGAKDLARQFRTVRANTIKIAEEIEESNYSFRPTPNSRTVGEVLAHIGLLTRFNVKVHAEDKATTLAGYNFGELMGPLMAEEMLPRTKAELMQLLKDEGEKYASFVEPLTDEFLAEMVEMPPGGDAAKTRFEMLLGVKEHEMSHRGQLMLMQRLLGQVPMMTRVMNERMAAMMAAPKK